MKCTLLGQLPLNREFKMQGMASITGVHFVLLSILISFLCISTWLSSPLIAGDSTIFIRGDSNVDGFVSLADAMTLVRYLHKSENEPACFDASDIDDSGQIDITDLVALVTFIFNIPGNNLPAEPYPDPGTDKTSDDSLDCRRGLKSNHQQGGGAAALLSPEEGDGEAENLASPRLYCRGLSLAIRAPTS